MTEFYLPWPDKKLNPNNMTHRLHKAKAVKEYRHVCGWETKRMMPIPIAGPKPHIHFEFYPPDRRRRDSDNCLASIKAGIDGISDALGIDDSKFVISFEMADEPFNRVKVTIK